MKEEYYIQGDPARAEEIKAEFKRLGIDTTAIDVGDEDFIYFSSNGLLYFEEFSNTLLKLFKTHPGYKELELPVEPKFNAGDWLCRKEKGDFPLLIADYDEEKGYLVKYNIGLKTYFGRDIIENEYRLWNFEDSKLGDILYDIAYNRIGIFGNFGHHPDGGSFNDKTYCYLIIYYDIDDKELYEETHNDMDGSDAVPATKEQRDLLFAKMKEAGYQWDADKKELKKIQPHYDISNFHAGMPVLVRADNVCRWDYSVFSRITGNEDWPFAVCNGVSFTQCIPFNGNKHLLGTTDMCDEMYINW